jgi:actin-like ATPase involved in cell morphogenesis
MAHGSAMAYALGIDLGTTFTAAAIVRDRGAQVVDLGTRAAAIPSVVFVKDTGDVLVGESAARRGLTEPSRVAREFKRRIGDPTPIVLAGSPFSAAALMARLLRWVVETVTSREGGPPGSVAVTHPATWGPYKLDLLTQAVRLAEVRVDTYLTEAEAAAVSYAAAERVAVGSIVGVYDLGGGTFDAAVLRRTEGGFEILGEPEGVEHLGGIDFDQALVSHAMAVAADELAGLDLTRPDDLAMLARIREECVAVKEALSADTEATITVPTPAGSSAVRVTRAEFESWIRPTLGDTVAALRRALRSVPVSPEDVEAFVLVGGSSRIPLVAELVGEELHRPVKVDAHPKHSVALGAALAASQHEPMAMPTLPPTPVGIPDPAPSPPTAIATPTPPAPAPAPAPAREPAPAAGRRTLHRTRRAVATRALAGVGALAVLAVVVAVTVTRGSAGDDGGAIAVPAGATACPRPPEVAVCITGVDVDGGTILADFATQEVELADPEGGRFAPDTLHPIFFFVDSDPRTGRIWGDASPFGGESTAGLQGFGTDDLPAGETSLCVLLQDDTGQVFAGTGNCAPVPT